MKLAASRPPLVSLIQNQRGAALFAAAVAMLLLSVLAASFLTLSRSEVLIARNDREAVAALYAAEAGANLGLWTLRQRLTRDLPGQAAGLSAQDLATTLLARYGTPEGAAQLLVDLARSSGGRNFSICPAGECPDPPWDRGASSGGETPDSQQAVLVLESDDPAFAARIVVSVAAPPVVVPGGSQAVLTYRWRIESAGTLGRARQVVNLVSRAPGATDGLVTIELSRAYTRFAHLLDDAARSADGVLAWMTSRDVYDGPVHSNTHFNIAGSPTFRAGLSQTEEQVRFNSSLLASDSNPPADTPRLGPTAAPCRLVDCAGFDRGLDYDPAAPGSDPIPLPGTEARAQQRSAALGEAIPTFPPNHPVFVGATATGETAGGIYVQGSVLDLELEANPGGLTGQRLTIQTSLARRTQITVDQAARTTTVAYQCHWNGVACTENGADPWTPETGIGIGTSTLLGVPNGVVFVNSGAVQALHGPRSGTAAVQRDTMLSIVADYNISVTGHVRYEVDPRGADRVNNILGVVSWNGDVVVDTPDGFGAVDLHLSVIVPNLDGGAGGEFRVARHDTRPVEGDAILLGGVIETTSGRFGTYSDTLATHGYGRNWTHDRRFAMRGLAPPVFPTLPRFLVLTNGLSLETYTWRQGR